MDWKEMLWDYVEWVAETLFSLLVLGCCFLVGAFVVWLTS